MKRKEKKREEKGEGRKRNRRKKLNGVKKNPDSPIAREQTANGMVTILS